MENDYLTFEQLEIGKTYWVVNGCWEFIVREIHLSTVDIYIPTIKENANIPKIGTFRLQIIEKK
ncbi:MAG: hypothetical protein ABI576_10285 [Flavobacterium sp.]